MFVFSFGLLTNVLGVIHNSWISSVLTATSVGGEVAALQRRLSQLRRMLQAMKQPELFDGSVPTSSVISDDVFIFGGQIESTGTGGLCSQDEEHMVFVNFPVKWTEEMQEVYLALCSCRRSGRWVSKAELSMWIDLPVEEVECCLRSLSEAGKAFSISNGCLWKLASGGAVAELSA
jgi:hypothetical protein